MDLLNATKMQAGYTMGLKPDGRDWSKLELPTNVNLTAVKCAGDGKVDIVGYHGMLIRGRASTWYIIAEEETQEHFWDLEWFEGELYLSTMLFVYQLKKGGL